MGNEYREGGLGSFQKTGLSQEERFADRQSGSLTFEEEMEKLRMGAKEVVKNRRFADLVEALLKRYGGNPNLLTSDVCERFLEQHPEIEYERGMVRDVAEEIASQGKSGGLH